MAETRIVNLENIRLADHGNGDAFVAKIGRAGPLSDRQAWAIR